MSKNSLVAVAAAFLTAGALSAPSFGESALDQLKAQAGGLDAPAPAAPAAKDHDLGGRVEDAFAHFFYAELPRLEPEGDHRLEADFSRVTLFYEKTFNKKKCPYDEALGNFHRISPQVYRSGFPTQEGFALLKRKGIKTVLSFLMPGETQAMPDPEARMVADAGMAYENVSVNWTEWPSFQQMDQAMAIMSDPSKQPVLIHCTCGIDRTGIFSAAYRIVAQGWTPERAAAEAEEFYWHVPVGDLAGFLSSYARYRAGAPSPAAPAS